MNTPIQKRPRPTLIIPSETQVREFDAKLFLACAAAERGFSSIVGSRYNIHLKIASLPRGIYLGKDIRGSSLKIFRIMVDLGFQIVALDEEALLTHPPAQYYQNRLSSEALRRVLATFAWGKKNAGLFRGFPGWGDVPIYETGNPRFDLLRPELRDFFMTERDRLRDQYGNFILVNTNFGTQNHYVPNLTSLHQPEGESSDAEDEFKAGLAAHRYAVFSHFQQMIPTLSESFPDFNIVIRPHPAENHGLWAKIAAPHSNVRVIFEGSALPWILACRTLIHNGCTTAIEAYLLDRPAVAYRPATSERYDMKLPNGLSMEAFDLNELNAALGLVVNGEAPLKTPDREKLFRKNLAGTDGTFASERILDVIEELGERTDLGWPGTIRYVRGRCRASLRTQGKLRNANVPGHKNNSEYQHHRFPGIHLSDVQERIARFGELLGRFRSVQAKQISENIFQIYPMDS
ncbi:MAG: hypothetical protein GY799_21915 [Desulfobulbaceae bacterium]|nr:hypothetical protein [Desulfobulbaceae bacterium]